MKRVTSKYSKLRIMGLLYKNNNKSVKQYKHFPQKISPNDINTREFFNDKISPQSMVTKQNLLGNETTFMKSPISNFSKKKKNFVNIIEYSDILSTFGKVNNQTLPLQYKQ